MYKQSKINKSKTKGITLIALIITIIVLLILAGVTINTLFNNGNAIDKAGQAKEETSHGVVKDSIVLGLSDYKLDTLAPGGEKDKSVVDYLKDNKGYIVEMDEGAYYKVEEKGRGDASLGKGQDKTTGDVYVIEKESEESESWELRYYKEKNETKENSRLLLVFTSNGSVAKDFEDEKTENDKVLEEAVEKSKNDDGTLDKDKLKQELDKLEQDKKIKDYTETPDVGIDVTMPDGTSYHIDKDGDITKNIPDEEYVGEKEPLYTETPANYIPIYTREDLQEVGTGNNVYIEQENRYCVYAINAGYILMEDIDLSDSPWTPIQNEITGIFEGSNKTIRNLNMNITSGGNYGLFATSAIAPIQNLNMTNVNIKVENVSVSTSNTINVGSITGVRNGGKIQNCVVTGYITSESAANIGGIVGKAEEKSYGPVNMSNVKSNTQMANKSYTGGIVGYYEGNTYFKIENAVNDGNIINSNASYIGGIIGYVQLSGTNPYDIKACENHGKITGNDYIGGMVGWSKGVIMANNCTNTGKITGGQYIGGIAGYVENNEGTSNILFISNNNYGKIGQGQFIGRCGRMYQCKYRCNKCFPVQ